MARRPTLAAACSAALLCAPASAFVPGISRSISWRRTGVASVVAAPRSRASVWPLSAVAGFDVSSVDGAWLHSVFTGLADAAATTVDSVAAAGTDAAAADNGGIFGLLTTATEQAIIMLHDLLKSGGIKEAYGPSIILFTLFVKAATFPLTYQQLASTTKMQAVQPKVKDIQKRLSSNPEAANKAIADLYQQEEINPLAGCLPSIAQIPIFISLYRALLNLAKEDKLAEPFLWLPSLEGPVYQAPPSETLNWLKSGWEGFTPPLGWHDTLAFLTVPVILVISQSISQQLMQPPQQKDSQNDTSQAILKYLPLMIGWFSLNVPSGLGLYWIVNNFFSTATAVLIRKQLSATMPVAAGAAPVAASSVVEEKGFARQSMRDVREDDSDDDSIDTVSEKPKGFGSDDDDDEIDGEIISAESGKAKKPKLAGSGKRKKKSRK